VPKVLFVAPSAYVLSGLATWLDYLVPELAGYGWDARLALVSGPRHHRPGQYLAAHPAERVAIAHCETGTAEGRSRALLRLLDEVQPDIAVSVNIPDLFVAINRQRQARRPGPHAVMSVHGIEAHLYADARRYRQVIDAVICTNRLSCALAGSLGGVDPRRTLYSAYGVRQPEWAEPVEAGERLRIVYSGRLETEQKRAGDLVGIARALQGRGVPFRLEIVGDGPDRDSLENALRAEIAAGSVHFHGHVPLEELKARIYPSAQALLITSYWETGPIVAWEAMAQGVPVVSSRYIGSGLEAALVDERNALLFDIGDVEGAAAALSRLWNEPATSRSLRAAARQLVVERYSIPVSVQAWDRSLRFVLTQAQAGAASLPPAKSAGRLDRWINPSAAETIRRALPILGTTASDAGGEWPHAHANLKSDAAFWQAARKADASPDRMGEIHVA